MGSTPISRSKKERHLLKADVSLWFRRPSAKGFACGENACGAQKKKSLETIKFQGFSVAEKEGFELVEIGFCALPANASQYLYVLQIQDFLKRKFYWMSMRVDRFYRGKGHFCGQIQVKDMCLRFSDCKTGNVSLYFAAIEHTAARQCLAAENRILMDKG